MRIRTVLSVGIALFFGLLTLAGYFIPFKPLSDLGGGLLYIAVFLGSVAVVVGVINLLRIHMRKAVSGKPGGGYSLVLFFSLLVTFIVVFVANYNHNDLVTIWIVRNVQLPLEASLSALVVFALLAGGVRLLYRRRDVMAFFFLGAALVVLFAAIPLPSLPPSQLGDLLKGLDDKRQQFASIFLSLAGGGGRGILLGMALGAAATGLRILMGVDRPYER
jgi:hypothetical protein